MNIYQIIHLAWGFAFTALGLGAILEGLRKGYDGIVAGVGVPAIYLGLCLLIGFSQTYGTSRSPKNHYPIIFAAITTLVLMGGGAVLADAMTGPGLMIGTMIPAMALGLLVYHEMHKIAVRLTK